MTARSVTTCGDVLGSEPSNLQPEEPERSAVDRESPEEELDLVLATVFLDIVVDVYSEKAVKEKSWEEIL